MATHHMAHKLFCVFLLLATIINVIIQPISALSFSSLEDSEIETTGNPHAKSFCDEQKNKNDNFKDEYPECSPSYCQPHLLLQPHRIIHTPMSTQSDTFLGIVIKKVLSVPIPIYQFKQPRRLSSLELPYEMVLVSDIDSAKGLIREVPTDPKISADSWFVGYRWMPIVCGESLHVGWKFEKIGKPNEFFYALIVSIKQKKDKSIIVAATSSFAEVVLDMLSIGTRAPKWMLSSASSVA